MENCNYFNGDKLAYDVYCKKYRNGEEEPQDTIDRLVKELADNEMEYARKLKRVSLDNLSSYGKGTVWAYKSAAKNGKLREVIEEQLHRYLDGFERLILGGSLIATLGTEQKLSLSNCFVIGSPADSLCGINRTLNEMENIFSHRGGVGMDLSTLRPKGSKINNAARFSEGVVSVMKHKFAESSKYIAQNGRRGALMLMYDSRGIDLLDFIRCKQDDTSITTANISVKMHDDFIKAANEDADYLLRFPVDADMSCFDKEVADSIPYNEVTEFLTDEGNVLVKKVKAKEIWDELVKCAWNKAEPGILFWDRIENYDPSSVYDGLKPLATNPCGEQPLAPYDTCRLLSFNLSSLVRNPFTKEAYVDMDDVYGAFYDIQWIGDDIVDLECRYVKRIVDSLVRENSDGGNNEIIAMWEKVIEVAKVGRRTGVGFTGLGDLFAKLGLPYGDPDMTERLFNTIFRAQLDSTIDLAIIRGAFNDGTFKEEGLGNMRNDWYGMVQERFPEQWERMHRFGRRNVSLNTCAPAGTISLLAQSTSGIEPLFLPYYKRKVKVLSSSEPYDVVDADGCRFKVYFVMHSGLKQWIQANHPEVDLDSLNDDTIKAFYEESPYFGNCAQDLDWKGRVRTQAHIQQYITSAISSTVNLDRSTTVEEVDALLKLASESGCKGITIYRDGCRDGVMTAADAPAPQGNQDEEVNAPKRPKSLPCNVIRFTNNSEKWIAFVGVYNNRPYEIFTGLANKLEIPSSVDKGNIIKSKSDGVSRYDFEYYDKNGERFVIEKINEIFNPEFWNYGKLLSALLRHRMPIVCLIRTLQGMKFSNETVNSWRNGVVRSLKKWVKDGEDAGENCPDCGRKLVFENGCKHCPDCGYSACN